MTHFEPRQGLDIDVAARIALPAVRRIGARTRDHVQAAAPDARTWVTAHDERVRRSHADTDGQLIPANLRFLLPKAGPRDTVAAGHDQAREPRDPDLPLAQRANCRCVAPAIPGLIARAVTLTEPVAEGTRVSARVSVRFPRIAESEHPSEPDRGGGWFRQAVAVAVAAAESSQARV